MTKITKYLNNGFCVGCGLCKSQFQDRIELQIDNEGINKVNLSNIEDCDLKWFEKYCPAINLYDLKDNMKNYSKIYGSYISCYLGHSLDDNIRYQASTGGIVTSLMIYLLEKKYVEAIVHIGKNKSNPLETCVMVSTNSNEIKENICGSLYSSTTLLSNIDNILKKYKKIAIVGKGCEIRAIDKIIKEKVYDHDNIYKIAIFCGGTPSRQAVKKICNDFEINLKNILNIRYRGNGWPGYFVITKKDMTQFRMNYRDSWVNYLSKEISLGCKICFDGLANYSDISTGDAWYGAKKDGYPSFTEKEGRNLIFSRSLKGEELLQHLSDDKFIKITKVNVNEDIELMQPSQDLRRKSAFYKIVALRLLLYKYPKVNYKLLWDIRDKQSHIITKIKYILGTIRRVLYQTRR